MSKKRGRLEIIRDILSVVRNHDNSIKPTPLLRYSNLSTQGFQEYMAELLDKSFLKEMPDKKGRKFFTLTDKGFKYLEKYSTITGFIEDFGL